jgi:hypothetical protein
MQGFTAWLKQHKDRADAVGDFARFAIQAPNSPGWKGGRTAWKRYFDANPPVQPGLLEALNEAWSEFGRLAAKTQHDAGKPPVEDGRNEAPMDPT